MNAYTAQRIAAQRTELLERSMRNAIVAGSRREPKAKRGRVARTAYALVFAATKTARARLT